MEENKSNKERKEQRQLQTEREFFAKASRVMEMPAEKAELAVRVLLSNIVRRITYTEADDLISQLPLNLKTELEDLPAGPDKSITAEHILQDLQEKLEVNQAEARVAAKKAWDFLAMMTDSIPQERGELHDVASQLPRDIEVLFGAIPNEEKNNLRQ